MCATTAAMMHSHPSHAPVQHQIANRLTVCFANVARRRSCYTAQRYVHKPIAELHSLVRSRRSCLLFPLATPLLNTRSSLLRRFALLLARWRALAAPAAPLVRIRCCGGFGLLLEAPKQMLPQIPVQMVHVRIRSCSRTSPHSLAAVDTTSSWTRRAVHVRYVFDAHAETEAHTC